MSILWCAIARMLKSRPPSYSDSLLYLPDSTDTFYIESPSSKPYKAPILKVPSISSVITETPISNSVAEGLIVGERSSPTETNYHYTSCEKWYNRLIGFGFHITLISLFETVFFFLFVSQTEDTALQNTVENYIRSTLTSCNQWTPNTTQYVEDILSLIINTTQVNTEGSLARTNRVLFNHSLQIQSWMYMTGLLSAILISTCIGQKAKLRLAWRRILIDNLCMVALLGLYEWTFFKTIIYNYENLSMPELNQHIVQQLQDSCGLLVDRI